ncbi:MAG: hypothetical protein ABI652_00890 [Acidobacteriota bacterium]
MSSRLTGPVGGDTGVYVWNTWVFRHEVIDRGRSPFSTLSVLPLSGPTDLSLHNYTVFADLLTLPLQPLVGVVAAFNLVYLLNVALAGVGMFLLARRITGGAEHTIAEAWLAGAVFACSPFLVARATAHFSLAAAAPLPFFVYWLDRAREKARLRDAAMAGICLAWAAFSDPYYAVYCLMLGACVIGGHLITITSARRAVPAPRLLRTLLDLAIAAIVVIVVGVTFIEHGSVQIGSLQVSIRSLYTPMLLLTVLAIARVLIVVTPRWTWQGSPALIPSVRLVATVGLVSAFLLAPEIFAMALRAAEGRLVSPPVLWRSSAPGLDLLMFFLPNPNHPLAPAALVDWVSRQPGRYEENVAALSWVAFAVMIAAWRWASFRPSRLWMAITVGFLSLAVGPFLRIAGIQTFVPTPWALLRYLPIVAEARMPPRFAAVVTMGFCVMFAAALVALSTRFPARRRVMLASIAALLVGELLAAPRPLYSAEIPIVYRAIAADPRPVRVLDLPFGIRDGLSSLGDFSAASQFYQTAHGKPLIGGYLSRVEHRDKDFHRRVPVLNVLFDFSEGRTPTPGQIAMAIESGPAFVAGANLGYVVVNTDHVSPAFRQFAIDALGLVPVQAADGLELFASTPRP